MRAVFPLLALAACPASEPQIRNLVPSMAVAPDAVDFGDVGPPLSATEGIFVTNAGGADLDIEVTLEGSDAFVLVDVTPGELVSINPGDELPIGIRFTPGTFRTYDARVVIESNDEENERVVVPITGRGVDLPFGDIEIRPSQTIVAPEPVPPGGLEQLPFEIHNVGDAPLTLGTLTIDRPQFSFAYDPSGETIQPGQSKLAVVDYAPTDPDPEGETALVTVPSSDPYEPEVMVQIVGNSEYFEFPIAVIDCPPQVLLTGPEYVNLSGAGSSDPMGFLPLSYRWRVTDRPEASDEDIVLDPDTTEDIDLYVDVAGSWEVELVVTNALGAESEPALCRFDAIPEDDLHVELSWDTTAADLDLHLVQGGAAIFDVPEDCNWCNRTPSWGAAGTDDDPRLDIDDRGGVGPENINILTPEAGTYEVKVHYYAEHGDGPVVATIHVWLDGVSVFTGSQVMTDNEIWDVGTANWPLATFTPAYGPLRDAGGNTTCN